MRHERAATISELLSLVRNVNDKLNDANQGTKIKIYPRAGKYSVMPYFEYIDPSNRNLKRKTTRLSAVQVAKVFDMQNTDYELCPETSQMVYLSNADKLDKLRDLWLKVSAQYAEGLSPVDKLKFKGKQSLYDYINAIISEKAKEGKTANEKISLLKHLKLADCSDKPISLIDDNYCIKFYNYLKNNSGLKRSTPSSVAQQLHIVLHKAVYDGFIDSNPCDKVPRNLKPKPANFDNSKHLSKKQLKQFETFFYSLSVPEPPQFFVNAAFHLWESARIFLFSCLTGLRISDIEQLTSDMVVNDGKHTHIAKKIQKTQSPTFKTLHPKAVALLSLYNDNPRLFYPIKRSTLAYNIRNALKLAGITLHFKPSIHVGRHTFATMLAEGGARSQTIQFQLDHKTPIMANRYIGITQQMADDSLKAFDW